MRRTGSPTCQAPKGCKHRRSRTTSLADATGQIRQQFGALDLDAGPRSARQARFIPTRAENTRNRADPLLYVNQVETPVSSCRNAPDREPRFLETVSVGAVAVKQASSRFRLHDAALSMPGNCIAVQPGNPLLSRKTPRGAGGHDGGLLRLSRSRVSRRRPQQPRYERFFVSIRWLRPSW